MKGEKYQDPKPAGEAELFDNSIQARLTSFRPLALLKELPSSSKKTQSIVIKDSETVHKVAEYYHWSVNELINTCLGLYIKAFFDQDQESQVVIEADTFSTLKKYAIANSENEAKYLRRALEIYIRFLQDGAIEEVRRAAHQFEDQSLPETLSLHLKQGLERVVDKGTTTKKIHLREGYIGEKSKVHRAFPMYSFTPLHKYKVEDPESKKQSIVVKNIKLVQKVAEYYRWSINELINVALDIYIMTFFDRDIKTSALMEIDAFSTLKKITFARGTTEARFIREALDIYVCLLQDEIIEKARKLDIVNMGQRSLQGVLCEILKKELRQSNDS